MPFPVGWPPRPTTGRKSLRFYVTGTSTTNFEDSAYLFVDGVGANPYTPLPVVDPGSSTVVTLPSTPYGSGEGDVGSPKAMIYASTIAVRSLGGALEISFDGVNIAGTVAAGELRIFRDRYEAGISVRSAGGAGFEVEAW